MIEVSARDRESRFTRVWLNGIEESNRCYYGILPDEPGKEGDGILFLFSLNEEGKKYLVDGPGGKMPAKEEIHGKVRWERIREDA